MNAKPWGLGLFLFLILTINTLPRAHAAVFGVKNFNELIVALIEALPGDTILLEDGVYPIAGTWAVQVYTDNLTIRGASGNRESVIIEGWGMNGQSHHGFYVNADHVTIADLTVQNVRNHCIQTGVDADHLLVRNCILRDAGEQILKVPAAPEPDFSQGGQVAGCLFEYTRGVGPRYYIGGIDVHRGKDWIVRDNEFRHIRSPAGSLAEHAIHFWNHSRNTLVERNRIITCDRGIGFGLGSSPHTGGIIRNNTIFHDGSPGFNDVGIGLESSPGTKVVNNTIFLSQAYPNAIEYRFFGTQDVLIANNLVGGRIQARDGALADLATNLSGAQAHWFKDSLEGDLHLAFAVPQVTGQGTALLDLEDDMDGEIRPLEDGVDIGADEWFGCLADHDMDHDVDGLDLFFLIHEKTLDCLGVFAGRFGRCPPL